MWHSPMMFIEAGCARNATSPFRHGRGYPVGYGTGSRLMAPLHKGWQSVVFSYFCWGLSFSIFSHWVTILNQGLIPHPLRVKARLVPNCRRPANGERHLQSV